MYLCEQTKFSFPTNKADHGKIEKASVSRYRSALVHATDHTRGH